VLALALALAYACARSRGAERGVFARDARRATNRPTSFARNRRKVLELGDAEEACMLADESDAGAVKLMASDEGPRDALRRAALRRLARAALPELRVARTALRRLLSCAHACITHTTPGPPACPPHTQIGECFIDCAPSEAAEHVQRETDVAKAAKGALEAELRAAESRMAVLKKTLYARFGKSINLEE
jgi:hypothetical protein